MLEFRELHRHAKRKGSNCLLENWKLLYFVFREQSIQILTRLLSRSAESLSSLRLSLLFPRSFLSRLLSRSFSFSWSWLLSLPSRLRSRLFLSPLESLLRSFSLELSLSCNQNGIEKKFKLYFPPKKRGILDFNVREIKTEKAEKGKNYFWAVKLLAVFAMGNEARCFGASC